MALSLIQAESMNLTDTYAFTGTVTGTGTTLPVGTIIPYAGVALPTGWLLCDGSQKTIAGTYQSLYNAITNSGNVFPYGGNTNGSGGTGSTHFRLPDLNGRLIVGKAATATRLVGTGNTRTVTANTSGVISSSQNIGLTANSGTIEIGMYVSGFTGNPEVWVTHITSQTSILVNTNVSAGSGDTLTFGIKDNMLGATGGAMNHTLTTTQIPAHTHTVSRASSGGSSTTVYQGAASNVAALATSSAGGGEAHTNIQPSIILNYLINY